MRFILLYVVYALHKTLLLSTSYFLLESLLERFPNVTTYTILDDVNFCIRIVFRNKEFMITENGQEQTRHWQSHAGIIKMWELAGQVPFELVQAHFRISLKISILNSENLKYDALLQNFARRRLIILVTS